MEDIPGRPQGLHGKVMETAEAAIQRFDPFSKIHQHVCGFHFYANDITRQVSVYTFPVMILFDKEQHCCQ